MFILSFLTIVRSYLKDAHHPSLSPTQSMTDQKSKSYILEIDDAVFLFLNGKLDPKYHQNLIQTLLDTDLHITRHPEMQQYCDYMVQEGFCYYVQQ
jgi:hypothetical protein